MVKHGGSMYQSYVKKQILARATDPVFVNRLLRNLAKDLNRGLFPSGE